MKLKFTALAICLAFLLSGCGRLEQSSSRYTLAMDTVMEFTVYGSRAEEGLDRVDEIVQELESLLSVTDPESAVYALNQTGRLAQVDGHLETLLKQALELGDRTRGALDVTIYPVVQAWGFTGGEYRVPTDAELEELLAGVDYTAVQWENGGIVLPDGCRVDFGSIAKGYAGAVAADALREMGVTSALLNLGGNVQTVGCKPDGSRWRIAVKDPKGQESGNTLGILELEDQAAVTSGGYERYFEENGKTYWHIIDPATGKPADSGLISVTVVGKDGALCDGLSTALFIMGKDAALELWRDWGGFEAVLVETDGTVTVTAGLAESFTLTGGNYTLAVAE